MRKMTVKDCKKNEFYQTPKWIFRVENLKLVDILVYTLAFNNWKLSERNGFVNEKGEVYFFLTHEKIKENLKIGRDSCIESIKRLVKEKIIIQEKTVGKPTKYYFSNEIPDIYLEKKINKESSQENPTTREAKNDDKVVEKLGLPYTENQYMNQSVFQDINKTILNNNNINKTITLSDNINL